LDEDEDKERGDQGSPRRLRKKTVCGDNLNHVGANRKYRHIDRWKIIEDMGPKRRSTGKFGKESDEHYPGTMTIKCHLRHFMVPFHVVKAETRISS
jgi:hypothetical protein